MSFHATRSFFHLSRVCTVCIPSFTFPVFARCAFFLSFFSCVFMQHLYCAFTRTSSFFHLSYGFTVCILSFLRTRYFLSPFLCVPTYPFLVSSFSFSTLRALSFTFPVCSHCMPSLSTVVRFHTVFSHCFFALFSHRVFTLRFQNEHRPRDFMKLSVTI